MKRILFIAATIILSGALSAQTKVPAMLAQRIAGKDKLHEIMQQVDSFYKTKPSSDNQSIREWKHWKRWEWEMSRYVNDDGKLVNTKKIYSDALLQEEQRRQQQPLTELNESTGQWTSIGPTAFTHVNGLYRGLGRINRIAFDPSNSTYMYAGMPNGGLWRSTNSGVSWAPLSSYGPNLGVSGIVVSHADPNDIYVLTGDGDGGGFITNFGYRSYSVGVMKSSNGGSSWTLQTNGLPPAGQWVGYAMTQSHTNPQVLLIASSNGLYRTDNGGNTWTEVINDFVTDVKFKPGSGLTCYAAGNGWFRYSTNGGLTWSQASFNQTISGSNRIQIGVSPANNNYVYLLCGPAFNGTFKGVWASSNSGQDFTIRTTVPNILGSKANGTDDSDQSGYDLAVAVSSTNINTIFTGGLCVWRSTTGGFTFSFSTLYKDTASLSIYIHPDIHDLQVNPANGDLWAATDGGLYRSTDDGLTWVDYSEDIGTAQPYHLAGTDSNPDILYFGSQDNGVKNRLTNTQTWRHIQGADGFDVIVDYNNTSRAWWSVNQSLRRTDNSGSASVCINVDCCTVGCDGYEWYANLAQHVTNPNTIFVGYSDVFKSTNSGDTYTNKESSGSWDIKTCPSNSNRIYAAGSFDYSASNPGQLSRSNDLGENWNFLIGGGQGYTRPKITSIGVNPSNSNFVWITFGGTNDTAKVFFSSDAGDNWSNINSAGLPNVPVNCIAVTSTNDVYIGTEIGVYYRPTGGNWTPYYNGLPRSPVTDLVINELSGKIRASTFGRGIWESPLHANCEVSINFNNTQTGINYYEASSYITSSALITGGNGTNIIYKGGNNVTLLPGFEANTGSEFKAYINGCGLGGIPDANGRLTSGIDYTSYRLPMGDSAKFPYGTIELNPAGTEITYRIYKVGNYSLQVTDDKGYIVQTLSAKQLAAGVHTISFIKPAVSQVLYLQLWYNKDLVHYQEIPY